MGDMLLSLGPYIVALMALAGTIYTIRSQQGKTRAEATQIMADAATVTIDTLNEEIARLNMKMAAQLLQIQDLRISAKRSLELTARLVQGLTALLDQLNSDGLLPTWSPDPDISRLIRLCMTDAEKLGDDRIDAQRLASAARPAKKPG